MPVIKTSHDYPPIPVRWMDWSAWDDETIDGAPDAGHQIVGNGTTEMEAIADFIEQWNDSECGEEAVFSGAGCRKCGQYSVDSLAIQGPDDTDMIMSDLATEVHCSCGNIYWLGIFCPVEVTA